MLHVFKGTRRRLGGLRASALAIALIVVATAATGAISASADKSEVPSGSKAIVGSWMVDVNRGPTLPALKSMHTYTLGHGLIENANGGATLRSTSHGAWKRTGRRTFAATKIFFRYDPGTGAYAGTLKLRREIKVAPDGQSFTGVSVGELRDPAGNVLPGSNTRRDIERGERINVEPVPQLP